MSAPSGGDSLERPRKEPPPASLLELHHPQGSKSPSFRVTNRYVTGSHIQTGRGNSGQWGRRNIVGGKVRALGYLHRAGWKFPTPSFRGVFPAEAAER